ncbi:unnamed protein product [Alternaria alternata]
MAAPTRCMATATRSIQSPQAARITYRTFASSTSSPAASSRKVAAANTTCLRQLQTARNATGKAATSCQSQTRNFSQSASRSKLKTIDQIRARNKGGQSKQKALASPKWAGPFHLVDHNGKPFSNEDMLGKYSLVYFGFTHCPDICPDELDKMALMYDKVVAECGNVLLPIMITCDPARDNPSVLKEYLAEFHPDFIGLTGNHEQIKDTCKAYRVYFSTPKDTKPGQDYLVDHSIYFYLMDPEGDFVEAIGRNFTADQAAKVISDHIKDWEKPLKKEMRWE